MSCERAVALGSRLETQFHAQVGHRSLDKTDEPFGQSKVQSVVREPSAQLMREDADRQAQGPQYGTGEHGGRGHQPPRNKAGGCALAMSPSGGSIEGWAFNVAQGATCSPPHIPYSFLRIASSPWRH